MLWRAYVQPTNADVTDPKQSAAPDSVDITLFGNFDIVLDHFSRIFKLYDTPTRAA